MCWPSCSSFGLMRARRLFCIRWLCGSSVLWCFGGEEGSQLRRGDGILAVDVVSVAGAAPDDGPESSGEVVARSGNSANWNSMAGSGTPYRSSCVGSTSPSKGAQRTKSGSSRSFFFSPFSPLSMLIFGKNRGERFGGKKYLCSVIFFYYYFFFLGVPWCCAVVVA